MAGNAPAVLYERTKEQTKELADLGLTAMKMATGQQPADLAKLGTMAGRSLIRDAKALGDAVVQSTPGQIVVGAMEISTVRSETVAIAREEEDRFKPKAPASKDTGGKGVSASTHPHLDAVKYRLTDAQGSLKDALRDSGHAASDFTRVEAAIDRRIAVLEGRADNLTKEEAKAAPPGRWGSNAPSWLGGESSGDAKNRETELRILRAARTELKSYGEGHNLHNAKAHREPEPSRSVSDLPDSVKQAARDAGKKANANDGRDHSPDTAPSPGVAKNERSGPSTPSASV
jgi:hypothetical protein